VELSRSAGLLGRTLDQAAGAGRTGRVPLAANLIGAGSDALDQAVLPDGRPELAVAIPGANETWGVLLVVGESPGTLGEADVDLGRVAADAIGAVVSGTQRAEEVSRLLHRAEALRRVASDIGSRLDLDRILAGLVDHAMVLFNGDRAAVFLGGPDRRATAEVSRGLSQGYLQSVVEFPRRSLPALAAAARRPMFATHYRDDSRAGDVRAAVVQEGFDTICSAPLLDALNVYHDEPYEWSADELETMAALAEQAAIAIKNAQNFAKMASWAAQLQSIQQLGARLSRLGDEREIGETIATELRQLIDYHNARVYRC